MHRVSARQHLTGSSSTWQASKTWFTSLQSQHYCVCFPTDCSRGGGWAPLQDKVMVCFPSQDKESLSPTIVLLLLFRLQCVCVCACVLNFTGCCYGRHKQCQHSCSGRHNLSNILALFQGHPLTMSTNHRGKPLDTVNRPKSTSILHVGEVSVEKVLSMASWQSWKSTMFARCG